MTIAVQEAFEDSDLTHEDQNSELEEDEEETKPLMMRFIGSFFGSFQKSKEKNQETNDEIER